MYPEFSSFNGFKEMAVDTLRCGGMCIKKHFYSSQVTVFKKSKKITKPNN